MAFDAARGTVLLFGGQIGATFMNDTWSWDGAVWTQLNPSTTPPPLLFPAMVYDVAHQKVVLVGGNAGQTWTWDGSNWTQQTPAHTPTPAMLASLTYDLNLNRVILFGGEPPVLSNSTWSWDGSDWTTINTSSSGADPYEREQATLVFDSVRNETVMFGGFSVRNGINAQTWLLKSSQWSQASVNTAPQPRESAAMVFDTVSGRGVLFGGTPGGAGNTLTRFGDTWVWDGLGWSRLAIPGPPARSSHAMAYDPIRKETVLFGGCLGNDIATSPCASPSADTWVLSNTQSVRPAVIIVPGILGTKLTSPQGIDCVNTGAASCVAWLSNCQIFQGGASQLPFFKKLLTGTEGSNPEDVFNPLRYNSDQTPITPLVVNDILNITPNPNSQGIACPLPIWLPQVQQDVLDCNQFPLNYTPSGQSQALGAPDCSRNIDPYGPLRDQIQNAGYTVTTFPYDWREDITTSGEKLNSLVRTLMTTSPKVALIAHSMGGLVVREMIRHHPELKDVITNIITIATPFGGSVDAYLKLQGWKALNEKFLTPDATKLTGGYWTSPYFLLPQSSFVTVNNQPVSNQAVYQGIYSPTLLPALPAQSNLRLAYSFWTANQNSVPLPNAFAIVGSGLPTASGLGIFNSVDGIVISPSTSYEYASGDGTVTADSAQATSLIPPENFRFTTDEHLLLPSNLAVMNAVVKTLDTGSMPSLPAPVIFPLPFIEAEVCSPVDISAQAAGGVFVGRGLIQVKGAHYISSQHGTEVVLPGGQYTLNLQGTAIGTFSLVITFQNLSGEKLGHTAFINIPVGPLTTGTLFVDTTSVGMLQLINGSSVVSIPGGPLPAASYIRLLSDVIATLQLPTGIEMSLTSKLTAAAASAARGDKKAAANIILAFSNEVEAQSGKQIPRQTGVALLSLANSAIMLLNTATE